MRNLSFNLVILFCSGEQRRYQGVAGNHVRASSPGTRYPKVFVLQLSLKPV